MDHKQSMGEFSAQSGQARSGYGADAGNGRVRHFIRFLSAPHSDDAPDEVKGVRHYPSGGSEPLGLLCRLHAVDISGWDVRFVA